MMRFVFCYTLLLTGINLFAQQDNEAYIEQYKSIAIIKMKQYGIPASITLAQGILESAAGTSKLAVHANNHFGIKCHGVWSGEKFYSDDDEKDECFRKYSDPEESFHDHSEFLKTRSRYAKLFELKNTDYKGWAHGLKEAGYATNPKYPQLLIGIIERYDLGRFDYMSESDIAQFKQPKKHPSKTNKDDVREIVIKDKRSILYNNRTPYIIAKRGDTPEKIAKEFEMMTWQIVRYNDLTKDTKLKEGERIYIKPKRNRAEKDYHIVKKGETMRTISQDYGVKMKKIYKKNNMQIGDMVKDGEKLNLRKRKR